MRLAIPPALDPAALEAVDREGRVCALSGATMGTGWQVRFVAPQGFAPDAARAAIAARLEDVIAQMSNWEAESAISRFNRAPLGAWQSLPEDFATVLAAGLAVAAASGGAFDPALGRSVARWGFGPEGEAGCGRPGAVEAVAAPWRAIELDGGRARRTSDVALDFSGIAKGFAVDALSRDLAALGLAAHLVEIGGELRGCGVKPDGWPWWVDLETPPGLRLPSTRVALCGLSVATSGDYRRWRQADGVRIAHSIDPRLGAPVANNVASVTVVHEEAMLADAWATALLVSGLEAGLRLAQEQGLAALMVRREEGGARDYMSPAFAALLD